MSSSFSAAQFNSAFSPTKLCNWEIPAIRERKVPKFHPAKTGMTPFIASDNGHLLRGKKMTSFQTGYETSAPPARWPEHTTLSSSSYGGAATMGYKGIQTSYLPCQTVYLRNNPDSVRAGERQLDQPPRPGCRGAAPMVAAALRRRTEHAGPIR